MIDFTNARFMKLRKVEDNSHKEIINPLLLPEEQILSGYKTIRDFVIFTDLRIISVNSQGLTGKKKDFTSIPYSKIQCFSVETAGVLDLDSELELYISGVGKIKFEFTSSSDIALIGQYIAARTLK